MYLLQVRIDGEREIWLSPANEYVPFECQEVLGFGLFIILLRN